MNEKIQKTENNFAKRTDVLGVYNVNGAQTTISRAEDADLVFDIALNGKLLSLALKRSQHDTGKSPYTRCMDGGCATAYKGNISLTIPSGLIWTAFPPVNKFLLLVPNTMNGMTPPSRLTM